MHCIVLHYYFCIIVIVAHLALNNWTDALKPYSCIHVLLQQMLQDPIGSLLYWVKTRLHNTNTSGSYVNKMRPFSVPNTTIDLRAPISRSYLSSQMEAHGWEGCLCPDRFASLPSQTQASVLWCLQNMRHTTFFGHLVHVGHEIIPGPVASSLKSHQENVMAKLLSGTII